MENKQTSQQNEIVDDSQNTALDAEKPQENAPETAVKKPRVWEIDFLRGFCVCLMVLDHLTMLIAAFFAPTWYGYDFALWDKFSMFCFNWFFESLTRRIIHPIVLFIFFSISGISCSFSRSNFKRGGLLALVALLYTLVTYGVQTLIFDSTEVLAPGSVFTSFGVLHFLAFCILLYAIIALATQKSKDQKWIIVGISAAIIIVVLCLYFLYTPPASTHRVFGIFFAPKDIYGNHLAFYEQYEISPGDLFSIIPYSAFFFAGVFLAPFLYPKRRSLLPKLDGKWHTPITFVGRYALYFYLAHLVVLAGILELATFALTGTWGI
ncbi:MAG: DUF1624 domain-containing protein [Clostridia bacterium]|nr:DUF1624 domain-containing protein [Clostridia bacterium]